MLRKTPSLFSIPFRSSRWLTAIFWFSGMFFQPGLVSGSVAIDQTCDQVAHQAAVESGVPVSVLQAITRTETGRRRNGATRPWPWTVNMEGTGRWFDEPSEALQYVNENFQRGARSFDVGCFQINYRWHGQHFSSIEEMFDPLANARYAARYLSELYSEKGNWDDAAGAYHSRTPRYANRYKARFRQFREAVMRNAPALTPAPPETSLATVEPVQPRPRQNLYPLLQPVSGTRGHGSLVALRSSGSARQLIGATE